jgi:hypothetical protein
MIQTFGAQFAAFINMVTEPFVAIHADLAEQPYRITGVSPFSICGKFDESLGNYTIFKPHTPRVRADIYKNYDNIIKKANCDYLIIDNSTAAMQLTTINGELYTMLPNEHTLFMDTFVNEKIEEVLKTSINPVNEGFTDKLREKYDLFVSSILKNYPPEKIILVRYRAQKFGISGGKIVKIVRDNKADKLISEIDDYFYSQVKCHVVETDHLYSVPDKVNMVREFSLEDIYSVERDILKCFGTIPTQYNIESKFSCTTPEGTFNFLSEYIIAGGTDISIMKKFLLKSFFTFDDILSLVYFSEKNDNKELLNEIAELIVQRKNSSPYNFSKKIYEKNVNFLRSYEYNNIKINSEFKNRIVIRLSSFEYMMITKKGFTRFKHHDTKTPFDWKKHYDAHFHYTVNEIDAALESFETYFERGRNGCNEPFVLDFKDINEFNDSLYYINYEEMLSNEKLYIKLADEAFVADESFVPKINFDFFFDKQNRIAIQSGGLAECMIYYAYHSIGVFNKEQENVYYLDLSFHVGPDTLGDTARLSCVIPEKYHSRSLKSNLSNKLLLRYFNLLAKGSFVDRKKIHAIILYRLGLKEIVAHQHFMSIKVKTDDKDVMDFDCPVSIFNYADIDMIEKRLKNDMDGIVNILFSYKRLYRKTFYEQKQDFEKLFTFPPFEKNDITNLNVSEKMLSTDAVVVHIRKGDFFTVDTVVLARQKDKYYKDQLERAWKIPGFENKHLFVFSDDHQYCRMFFNELGLGIAGDKISYVKGNTHFESFRDMQLMSLGKIIIMSQSGFNQVAGLMSKRAEYLLSVGTGYYDIFPKGQTLWHRGHPEELTGYEAEIIEENINTTDSTAQPETSEHNENETKINRKA